MRERLKKIKEEAMKCLGHYWGPYPYGRGVMAIDPGELLYMVDEIFRLERLNETLAKEHVQRGLDILALEAEVKELRGGMQDLLALHGKRSR